MIANQNNDEKPDYLYRSGVGAMVINCQKKIFVGKRIDNNSNAWQMPQGGIDSGENEDDAVYRELFEETGIPSHSLKIIKKSSKYFYYNLPYKLQKKFWGGKYLGQKQRWYLLEFCADDSLINVNSETPEFSEWQWVEKTILIDLIVNFKKELYREVLNEFRQYL
ncbi:MAG: RNA pyrophosphohydrolase [Alphaproteobacteria bacterium]